jgi:hypothetical protein
MTNLQRKLTSAIATGALLFSTALPALGVTIELSGNGVDSYNKADVELESETYVNQTNTANITNDVYAVSDSGNNDANRNTGGDVSIDTGSAGTLVNLDTTANSNVAEVDGCCAPDVDVKISGNGDDSYNKVELDVNEDQKDPAIYVGQSNLANVSNYVDAYAKTGYNDAKSNTGGDVEILTGNALTGVDIKNLLNSNSAIVGGEGGAPSISAQILGNGVDSYNKIDLDFEHEILVMQDNTANLTNDVFAKSVSGFNDANRNTGGGVSIDTGDAVTDVSIDNMANFNWADVDCGCVFDVWAKIAGNGDDSFNKIEADLEAESDLTQGNLANFRNPVDAFAKTGYNDARSNTGDPGDDPSIFTGNATTVVDVSNEANTNLKGFELGWEFPDWELPEEWEEANFEFGFEWAAVWAWMHGLVS